jgi:eukaryotic-like serine/threonine-protein kinase
LTPERWAQIEDLFHRAAECDATRRDALLDEGCNGDLELRQEVEELLSYGADSRDRVQAAINSEIHYFAFSMVGEFVSHYHILDALGGGGMGLVYKAEDLRLGRRVALKFLPEGSDNDPAALARFEREARAASALEHANICPIYEFGEHEGRSFLVMQLLEGQTLRELLAKTKVKTSKHESSVKSPRCQALALDQVVDLAIQLANGLQAAHQKGIIHRDIKPANIFVTNQGQAKILDFGLAKLARSTTEEAEDPEHTSFGERWLWTLALLGQHQQPGGGSTRQAREVSSLATADPLLSRTGVAMGTAGYMSPEQMRGETVDARTDLFSFGLVLYEMATGQQTFSGETATVLRNAILGQTPHPVRKLNPEIPHGLERIVDKALQKNRDLRYQSATEILTDLKGLTAPKRSALTLPLWNKRAVLAGVVSVALIAVTLWSVDSYVRRQRSRRLSETDTVVLADFANTTGESVFDGSLRQALSMQLQQSPFLNVLSDAKVNTTLKFMNLPLNARLTQKVAHEVCLRTNSKAVVEGSIASAETGFTVGLKALHCQTGDVLGSANSGANDRRAVLPALSRASEVLREELGESLPPAEGNSSRLDQATTSSLEALKSYSQGQAVMSSTGSAEAIPYYKRAIELDPNFAHAYAALTVAYGNLNQHILEEEYRKKACELRDRVAGRERFSIEADCCAGPDSPKAIEIYLRWIQAYPRDAVAHLNLANRVVQLGDLEKATEQTLEYVRLNPDTALGYTNLAEDYISLNRFDEAEVILRQAQARNLDGFYLRFVRYYLAFLEGDEAAMREQVSWATGKAGAEDALLSAESDTHAYYGQISEARTLSLRAAGSAQKAGAPDAAAVWLADGALREAEYGFAPQARKAVADAAALAPGEDVFRTLALARSGDTARALKWVEKMEQGSPSATNLQVYWLPTIKAAVELERGDPQQAIQVLSKTSAHDYAELGPNQGGTMYSVYLRGLAYLKASQSDAAAKQFQDILDHRGLIFNFPLGALAHLQLARARRMGGDLAGARTAYQDFLALWKNADPDIPILKQAKAEYAKLQ